MISHNLDFFNKSDRWIKSLSPGFLYIPSQLNSPIYQTQENTQKRRDVKEMGSALVLPLSPCTRIGSVFETDYTSHFLVRRVSGTCKFISKSPLTKWTNQMVLDNKMEAWGGRHDRGWQWRGGGRCVQVAVNNGPAWNTEEGTGCVKRILVKGNEAGYNPAKKSQGTSQVPGLNIQ